MSVSTSIQQANRKLARQINDEARKNPRSPYAGKFVGIANGQVVVVADNLDEIARQLRRSEPDTTKTFCIEAGVDYDAVKEIWAITPTNSQPSSPARLGSRCPSRPPHNYQGR